MKYKMLTDRKLPAVYSLNRTILQMKRQEEQNNFFCAVLLSTFYRYQSVTQFLHHNMEIKTMHLMYSKVQLI